MAESEVWMSTFVKRDKRLRLTCGVSCAAAAVLALAHHADGQSQPWRYVPALTGDWESVRELAVWDEIGLDPDALEWSETVAPEARRVAAIIKYRDVDEDGLPDVFWSIYDGEESHAFFCHASSIDQWKLPLSLGRCRYDSWIWHDGPDLLAPPMPGSLIAAGRVLLGAPHNTGVPESVNEADTIYDFVDDKLVEVVRDEGRTRYRDLMRWSILQANDEGDLLFYTFREGPGGASLGFDAKVLEAGQQRLKSIDTPTESELIRLHRKEWPPRPVPEGTGDLHPLRVSRELSGFPNDVLQRKTWHHLEIDPSIHDFKQDIDLTQEDLDRGPSHVWYIHTEVVYDDFDRNGLPDAFIVLEQGFNCHWLVMMQTQPNQWSCAGITGDIWYEHGFNLEQSPPLPEVHHLDGRVFIVARSGTTHDLGSRIKETLYVLHDGLLQELWSEVVHGHRHASQQLTLRQSDNGVDMTVQTWSDFLKELNGGAPDRVRTWVLSSGSLQLIPVDQ